MRANDTVNRSSRLSPPEEEKFRIPYEGDIGLSNLNALTDQVMEEPGFVELVQLNHFKIANNLRNLAYEMRKAGAIIEYFAPNRKKGSSVASLPERMAHFGVGWGH